MEINITDLMLSDHSKIKRLMNAFIKNPDKKNFNTFNWALQKHLFVEEKAILIEYMSEKTTESMLIILHQHIKILKTLEEFRKKLSKNEDINFTNFNALLEEHIEVEERDIYPELDRILTLEKKQEIQEKIRSIVI